MSRKNTLAKSAALCALALTVLVAAGATSASAATWTSEGSKFTEAASRTKLKVSVKGTLKGRILGLAIHLSAGKLASSGGKLFQEGTKAKGSVSLEFSELTISEPAGCKVKSPIKTKALTSELVDHTGSEKQFDKFFPEEGEIFATVTVEGCAVAGNYNVKGVVYGEAEKWGTSLVEQPLNFSPAINKTLGGSLTLGTEPAEFIAETINMLESEKKFGADT